jgi:hypothetical protein
MRLVAVLLALAVTAVAAQPVHTPIRTDFGTPIPTDFKIKPPGADAPGNAKRFSGVWAGKWAKVLDHTLVVESIDGRNVQLIYSWGIAPQGRDPDQPGYARVDGVLEEDGSLRVALGTGARVTYWLSGDGRMLAGTWVRENRRVEGVFTRRELP